MRLIVHGQQAFGKSVLEALVERGENIVGVYCEPDKQNRLDPIKEYALAQGLDVLQPKSYRQPQVWDQIESLQADLCVMAFVTLFVPEQALNLPTQGSIQYHPSLLPLHRGGSAINWPLIWGRKQTGLSIFWPDDGLDEGPILMQKTVAISDDDTLGSLYFDKLFPLGVEAMVESVDLVRDGKAPRIPQDHAKATYEGWCKANLVQINWHLPLQTTWDLIRGANPQPGAWTTFAGNKLNIYDCKKVSEAKSVQPGQIMHISSDGVLVAAPDGQLLVQRLRGENGKKVAAEQWALAVGLKVGARFGG